MGSGILGIGVGALQAAQTGLLVTSHNISNANTAGYTRQVIVQASNGGELTGSGFVGQGVTVTSVQRMYNQFVANQVNTAQAQSSQLDAQYGQISQIDNLLSSDSAGLAPALQDFFKGVQGVSSNPGSLASRQTMVANAQALVDRFQSMNQSLADMSQTVNDRIQDDITQINATSSQIASLNKIITDTEATAGNGSPANDLRDQRDQLVADLNKLVKTTVVKQSDGSYNVFAGNGLSMVVGAQSFNLAATSSPTDSTQVAVAYTGQSGSTIPLPESALTGGELGGLLQFRSTALTSARNAIDRVALGVATEFNNQHILGQDMNGVMGGKLFSTPPPLVSPSTNNTGGGTVSLAVSSTGQLTASDYNLKYDGTSYTLTRLSDKTATTVASFPTTIDGMTINLTGAPAAGDEFSLRPMYGAAGTMKLLTSDPAAIAAAAPMRTSTAATNTGTATISAGSVDPTAGVAPSANLQQPVTITFTGASTFDVTGTGTGNPTAVSYSPGGNISYNGWTVQISGAPKAGDTFTIGPNTNGTADNRNAVALGQLQTKNTLGNNSTSFSGAYGQLVSQVGSQTRQLQVTSEAQGTTLKQAIQSQQSDSGVNLDEEAANLLKYQQAYQAAGKLLAIVQQLFGTLLNLGGGQ